MNDEHSKINIFEEIKAKLVDEGFIRNFGTSITLNMGREFEKHLKRHFEKLKNEFKKINKDSNDFITKEEMKEFFKSYQSKKQVGVNLSDDNLEKLFELIDVNKDSQLTIKEFVVAYIILEEKIRIKNFKYQKMMQEFLESKEEYDRQMRVNKDEELNFHGVSKTSELKIYLIEAQSLKPMDYTGKSDPYVVFSLGEEKLTSTYKEQTLNPVWNEEFVMSPDSKERVLKVEVYDKDMVGSPDFEGLFHIPLRNLESQRKFDDWFPLHNKDGSLAQGKLHLRLQFLWSRYAYYENLSNEAERKLNLVKQEMDKLSRYLELFEEPFGLVLYGEIENLLKTKIEDEIEEISTLRKSNSIVNSSAEKFRVGMRYHMDKKKIIAGSISII